jgi:hypothetical protein
VNETQVSANAPVYQGYFSNINTSHQHRRSFGQSKTNDAQLIGLFGKEAKIDIH